MQDTFARVLSKPRMLSGDDELAYLMRVLRNTFFTGRRTASRRPVTAATLDDVAALDGRPTSQPERALDVQELYAAIAQLPEDFRLALVSVDILGLSYREAARALHTREATITTRLYRARRQVVRQLSDEPERTSEESVSGRASEPQSELSGSQGEPRRARTPTDGHDPHHKLPPQREGSTPRERLAEQRNL